jgi:regulator of sirC expression with transglutaminase-like and TPR domain
MDTGFKQDLSSLTLLDAMTVITTYLRPDVSAEKVQQQLQVLCQKAEAALADEVSAELRLEKLLKLFYGQWGFGDASGAYRLSDRLWVDKVLTSRVGSAVSLGAVLLHIAQCLQLPLSPVIFPAQLILRADTEQGEMWFINPFNGETLDEHTLNVWIKGTIGTTAELDDDDLQQASAEDVIRKLLDTLKLSLMEENQMELALKVSQLLLELNPEDPYIIRDRGLIYAQLDCEHVALNDLHYFIESCPDDPVSEMIKIQINTLGTKPVILH